MMLFMHSIFEDHVRVANLTIDNTCAGRKLLSLIVPAEIADMLRTETSRRESNEASILFAKRYLQPNARPYHEDALSDVSCLAEFKGGVRPLLAAPCRSAPESQPPSQKSPPIPPSLGSHAPPTEDDGGG
jgi:hypothetical protein